MEEKYFNCVQYNYFMDVLYFISKIVIAAIETPYYVLLFEINGFSTKKNLVSLYIFIFISLFVESFLIAI